jgi:hypothetical protein
MVKVVGSVLRSVFKVSVEGGKVQYIHRSVYLASCELSINGWLGLSGSTIVSYVCGIDVCVPGLPKLSYMWTSLNYVMCGDGHTLKREELNVNLNEIKLAL